MSSSLHRRHRHKAIQISDPGRILDLVMNLNDVTCAALQAKINDYLLEECEAELVFGVIVHGERKEAYIETILRTTLDKKNKINVSQNWTDVLKSGMESVMVFGNCAEDVRTIVAPFLQKENTNKKRVVMQPISGKPFSLLMFVVAPKEVQEKVVLLISECFLFCWPTIKKTIWYEYECSLKQKCQHLLRIAKRLFSQVATLDTLLQLTMEQAKHLIRAQYCTVRLVDVDKMELVEACQSTKGGEAEEKKERRFPMDSGISGYVLKTGNVVNAKCVEDHPAYSPLVDNLPGVVIKTLLCFPIREQAGIIGVGTLINKIGEPYFDAMDEEMALAFSIYCGVCIIHSVVYQKIREAHIRNTLANELVMYHMKVADSEIEKLLDCTGFHSHPHFQSLHFNHRALPMRELTCYALKMFQDLGFIQRFDLKRRKLAQFILHVKKGYRDVPYHNWLHGFNVAQWAYAALVNYRLVAQGYFSDLQAFMYLIAGLTHDLDHRGTTNSFHIQGQTTLAALYSSEGSVMERHHLAQAMCILNTEGCDILEKLPRREYDKALTLLRDFVLASDLSNYFKNLAEYKAISYEYLKGNRVHVNALQSLLMNAADLSDQLKDWGSVKKTAAAVLTEFFKQGDVEKSRGDLPPIIMDREKCFIPELEIQFLQATCLPLYEMLGRILPKAAPCSKIIENHMERWDGAKPIFAEVPTTAGLAVLLSPELDILIEANLLERARQAREAEAAAAAAAEDDEEEKEKEKEKKK